MGASPPVVILQRNFCKSDSTGGEHIQLLTTPELSGFRNLLTRRAARGREQLSASRLTPRQGARHLKDSESGSVVSVRTPAPGLVPLATRPRYWEKLSGK